MRSTSLAVTLGAIAAVACGCGAPPGPEAPPNLAANPAAPQWQQFCERAHDWNDMNVILANRGGQGWELVGLNGHVACFERPAPTAASPANGITPSSRNPI